jgi:hypothetical protein
MMSANAALASLLHLRLTAAARGPANRVAGIAQHFARASQGRAAASLVDD